MLDVDDFFIKIDVLPPQCSQFSYPYPGKTQKIEHLFVPGVLYSRQEHILFILSKGNFFFAALVCPWNLNHDTGIAVNHFIRNGKLHTFSQSAQRIPHRAVSHTVQFHGVQSFLYVQRFNFTDFHITDIKSECPGKTIPHRINACGFYFMRFDFFEPLIKPFIQCNSVFPVIYTIACLFFLILEFLKQ